MKQIAIIADDLTGANDTGVQFCQQGLRTLVIIDSEKINLKEHTREVLAINADTRHLTASEAYQRVYNLSQSLKKANIARIYKKIDSTLRGHPGAELEAVMDAWQAEIALVVPAFPANRRVVRDGYLVVDSEDSAKKGNLVYAGSYYIPAVLQKEMNRRVGKINLGVIRQGIKELIAAVEAAKIENQVLVLDAVNDKDLQIIASTINHLSLNTIVAGAAGLAFQIARTWKLKFYLETSLKQKGIILLVVGSRNPVTAVQVQQLIDYTGCQPVWVNAETILSGESEAEIERVLREYGTRVNKNELLIIAVSSLFKQNPRYQDSETSGKTIAAALGTIVKRILSTDKVKRLIVTGGDTAVHVCRALETRGIDLIAELLPGIPLGCLESNCVQALPIVTKAGGFGPPDAFIKIIQQLNQEGS